MPIHRIARFHLFLFILLTACCFTAVRSSAQERIKEFTLEDIFTSGKFSVRGIRGFQWMRGGKAYSYLETDTAKKQTDVWSYDVASGRKTKLVEGASLVLSKTDTSFTIRSYFWTPDEKDILFTGTLPSRAVKTGGNLFLYEREKKHFRQLTNSDKEQMNMKFSPDGKRIGLVRDNNLFSIDVETGEEKQLTFDGAEHRLNGHFDWVYEEEFSIIDGWQWSPDGRMIAYWQLDETRVPEFPIVDFLPLHQAVSHMRYPKPGDPNSMVRIGVVDLARGGTIWMDVGAPFDSAQDTYIPRISWTPDGSLMIHRLNRQQNRLDVYLADPRTGSSHIILSESEKTWVDIKTDYLFLKNAKQFIWSSERDGFLHLYLYDLNGRLIRQLTQGQWDVERIAGFDEDKGTVYFTASVTSPLDRDLYAVNLNGGAFKRITKDPGSHSVNLSPDASVFVDNFSDANTPARSTLRRIDGSAIRVLDEGTIPALAEYRISPKTFFTFTTIDGVSLNGWMIKPPDFDPSRKYPVLLEVYGGPGSQTVRNAWGGSYYLWYQMLAQKGYIVVSVDNRGTGARGKEFKSITYKNLGKWESNDQIQAARYLAGLPYVDAGRIGIWGWSYGGYMTLMSMLNGADVFRAGVAVAPVTHWKFYDSIYTERYMLTPAENPEGYDESAPLTHAKRLRGKLLEIHGTADDNVHWQNTVSMVGELIKEGKQFETAFYPGGMHGIGGGKVRLQLFTKITTFILQNL